MASLKPAFTLDSVINFQPTMNFGIPATAAEKVTPMIQDRITSFTLLAVRLNQAALVFPGTIQIIRDEDQFGHKVVLKLSGIKKVITYILFGNIFYVILTSIFSSIFLVKETKDALPKFTQGFQAVAWFFSFVIFLRVVSKPLRLANVINQMSRIERKMAVSGFRCIGLFFAKYLPRIMLSIYVASNLTSSLVLADTFINIPRSWRSFVVFFATRGDARWGFVGHLSDAQIEVYDIGSNVLEVFVKMGLGLYFILFHLFFAYVEIFGNILASTMAFSSCLLVYTFQRSLKNREFQVPHATVLEIAGDFVDLFELIEDAVGWIIFYFCFACVPYFATNIQDVAHGTWAQGIVYCCYAFTFCVTNISAALCCPWLKYVATWYRRQLTATSALALGTAKPAFIPNTGVSTERRFDVLMQEMSVREIGIRGKMFTGSFSFFGQVCGLVITYAVLWYQLKA